MAPTAQARPPFLDPAPLPWAARALATVLLVLFVLGLAAMVLVHVPETVSAAFVIEPMRGTNPVRTLHEGTVAAVSVEDAQAVQKAAVLFVIASEPVGDRIAERQMLDARIAGWSARVANERQKYASRQQADEQEQRRLEQRLVALERQAALKKQQLTLSQDIAARMQKSLDTGVASWMDASRPQLEVNRLAGELEQVQSDMVDASNALARLTFEMSSNRAAFDELQRAIGEDATSHRARKRVLDDDPTRAGNGMIVASPCDGTVVKLHVKNTGAVVHEGDVLAEVVCAGERLQVELLLPERGMALVRVGQAVKLLYDAFPYQRYGVHFGTLRWVSPASTTGTRGTTFRALADLDADTISVEGQQRPVLAGMTGRAAVIVGRRSLVSYAIEPLRQLRESLAVAPSR